MLYETKTNITRLNYLNYIRLNKKRNLDILKLFEKNVFFLFTIHTNI